MPYIIAIVVVVVLALVFFLSGKDSDELTTQVTGVPNEKIELAEPETPNTEVSETGTPTEATEAANTPVETGSEMDATEPHSDAGVMSNDGLADGTYEATASYLTPKQTEHVMDVTLTVSDGVVSEANVLYDGAAPKTPQHSAFDATYEAVVIGEEVEDLDLSRVGGASLTTGAFNAAVDKILAENA